jgi:hypothetical protein
VLDRGRHDRHEARDRAVHALDVGHQLGVPAGGEPHAHRRSADGAIELLDRLRVRRPAVVLTQHGAQALAHVEGAREIGRAHAVAAVHEPALGEPLAQGLGARELVLSALEVDAVDEALHEVQRLGGRLGGCRVARCHNWLNSLAGRLIPV